MLGCSPPCSSSPLKSNRPCGTCTAWGQHSTPQHSMGWRASSERHRFEGDHLHHHRFGGHHLHHQQNRATAAACDSSYRATAAARDTSYLPLTLQHPSHRGRRRERGPRRSRGSCGRGRAWRANRGSDSTPAVSQADVSQSVSQCSTVQSKEEMVPGTPTFAFFPSTSKTLMGGLDTAPPT